MPVNSMEHQEKASVRLRIVVIGGGLAGLTSAYALSCAGHDVTIVEKRDGSIIPQSFGVTQSPPNMTKILCRWGLKPLLDREAEKCASLVMRNGRAGDLIGAMHFDKDFLHDLLADFLYLRTQKLAEIFQQLVDDEGANIVSATVTAIETSPDSATLTLDNGQTLTGDFFVCADGYNSTFSHLVSPPPDDDPAAVIAHVLLTFTLPMDAVVQDEDMKFMLDPTHWQVWFGAGFVFHTSALDGGKYLSATLTSHYKRPILAGDEQWMDRSFEYWGIDLERFEPRARKILSLVKTASSRILRARPNVTDLVCENAKIVLVGDAAHPILPGGNQHVGLTIEEAETLRCIFSRVHHRDQISGFLAAYEEIRLPRTNQVVDYDRTMQETLKIPDGPQQDGLYAMLTQSMAHGDWDHMDEIGFKMVWGEELNIYTHDATEQVDDWWTKWGTQMSKKVPHSHRDANHAPDHSSLIPGLHRVSFSQSHRPL